MSDLPPAPPVELQYATPQADGRVLLLVRLAIIFNYIMAGLDIAYAVFLVVMSIVMYVLFTRLAAAGMPPVPAPAGMGAATATAAATAPATASAPAFAFAPETASALATEPAPPPASAPVGFAPFGAGPGAPVAVPPTPAVLKAQAALTVLMYSGMGLASLLAGILKIIGARKLSRRGAHTWVWAMAMGIVGCGQLWCSLLCVIPAAVGVYTIVILCFRNVQAYVRGEMHWPATQGLGPMA